MKTQIGHAYHIRDHGIDTIEMTLHRDQYEAIYPYAHTVVSFFAEATPRGKQSVGYQEEKSKLGDDWVSSLDAEPELLIEHMRAAGLDDHAIEDILVDAHYARMNHCNECWERYHRR